jgi:putative PIN family toxin of toxin-antitoxin system
VPGAPLLRVVLDTNIYIAALSHPRERNAKLWTGARERRYQLLVSVPIIREVADVLRRDFAWAESDLQQRIRVVAQVPEIVITKRTLDLVPADPDDNRILECAIDGRADLIVTNDHHLLDLKSCLDIPIIAGPDFRRILGMP